MEETEAGRRNIRVHAEEWKEVGGDVIAAVTIEKEEANSSLICDEEEDVLRGTVTLLNLMTAY